MIQPGKYDIVIQQNADFDLSFKLEDSSSDPFDLTDATVESEVWTAGKASKLVDFTVTIDDAANGEFTLSLTETQTAGLTAGTAYYDVRITTGTSTYYWVRGIVTIQTGYTE